jgi:hypothetical protein
MLTAQNKRIIMSIAKAIIEIANDNKGAPAGPIYACLSTEYGMKLPGFNDIMGTLVRSGFLTFSDDVYYATDKGINWAGRFNNAI